MSYTSKNKAIRAARKLLKLMKGSGWKMRVWENLGWHIGVQNRYVSVYPSTYVTGKLTYYALVGKGGTGEGIWSNKNKSYKDPNRAAMESICKALAVSQEYRDIATQSAEIYGLI